MKTQSNPNPLSESDSLTASSEHTDEIYRQEMVIEYRIKARKLARSLLKKWHARMDCQEIDSLVDLALCEAVIRYDASKGASFMTFLFYHLRGQLIRAITRAANQHTFVSHNIEEEAGRRRLECGDAQVTEWIGGNSVRPDEALVKKQLVELSQQACGELNELEQEVIARVYSQGEQLLDVARSLGYSRCHISRVKKKALQHLYRSIAHHVMTDEELRNSDRFKFRMGERRQSSRRKEVRNEDALDRAVA